MNAGGDGGRVKALVVRNGQLIAGGQFQRSGESEIHQVARWTGTGAGEGEWVPVGDFPGRFSSGAGAVNALAEFNGDLIAAGDFVFARADPEETVHRIARWDGSEWRSVGDGLDRPVEALAVYNGELIAGGTFRSSGDQQLNRIGAWDGTHWRPLGSGIGQGDALTGVRALQMYRGRLIAAGSFRRAGGVIVNGIAAWDGTAWSALGRGVEDGNVLSLAVGGGRLYVGGRFTRVDGIDASSIATWNGVTRRWGSMGEGITGGRVNLLAMYEGQVVAGGFFFNAGSSGVAIAAWSADSARSAPDSTGVNALEVYQGELVAGGWFSRADSVDASGGEFRWRALAAAREGLGIVRCSRSIAAN